MKVNKDKYFCLHYNDNKYKVRIPASDDTTMCPKEL